MAWRYGVCVLALVLLPAVAMHTLMVAVAALFMIVTGIFAFADGGIVLIGVALAALALMMLRLCWWMFTARAQVLRWHRAMLGAVFVVAAVVAWMLAPADLVTARAVVSVALLHGLYGIGLAVHAWEDTGSA